MQVNWVRCLDLVPDGHESKIGRSVTKVKNKICNGVHMTGMPATMQKKICMTSAMCTTNMKAPNF